MAIEMLSQTLLFARVSESEKLFYGIYTKGVLAKIIKIKGKK